MSGTPSLLVVDDDEAILAELTEALTRHRGTWRLVFESAPSRALEHMRSSPFDVVLTDLRMPEIDGLGLISEMRTFAPDAIYILLSGNADLESAIKAVNDAKAFKFLTKPCNLPALFDVLDEAQDVAAANRTLHLIEASGEALSHVESPVVILDRAHKIVHRNEAAKALFDKEDALVISASGQFQTPSSAQTKTLHQAFNRIRSEHLNGHGKTILTIDRGCDQRPLALFVSTMDGPKEGERFVVLILIDPTLKRLASAEDLSHLLRITRSEANVVFGIAGGLNVEEAAKSANVSVSTARSYLKSAFAKTGTKRQADLVRLALSVSP